MPRRGHRGENSCGKKLRLGQTEKHLRRNRSQEAVTKGLSEMGKRLKKLKTEEKKNLQASPSAEKSREKITAPHFHASPNGKKAFGTDSFLI